MNAKWIAPVIGCVAIAAFATRPSIADYQRETDALFAQARQNSFSTGAFGQWLGLAVADNVRSGEYSDLLLMSEYTVTIGRSPVLRCYGLFHSITCSKMAPPADGADNRQPSPS